MRFCDSRGLDVRLVKRVHFFLHSCRNNEVNACNKCEQDEYVQISQSSFFVMIG